MVSGNPYISTMRATMNEEKAPMAFQSRLERGWKKLAAKMMNTAELMMTRNQSP
jgi:hypothetical protein